MVPLCTYLKGFSEENKKNKTQFNVAEFREILFNPKSSTAHFNCQCSFRGQTPLMLAALDENIEAFELLLSHEKIDPMVRDFDNCTVMTHCIFSGLTRCFEILVESQRIDLNFIHDTGLTSLEQAMYVKRLDYCKLLLTAGADCSSHEEGGRNHLHYYACLPLPQMLKTMDCYEEYTKDELIALQVDCAELVLKNSQISSIATDSDGISPLHLCCKYNQVSLLKLFISKLEKDDLKEGLNSEDLDYHFTPLLFCCQGDNFYKNEYKWPATSNLDCARLLLSLKSNVLDLTHTFETMHGMTHLIYLASVPPLSTRQLEIAKLMLSRSDVDTQYSDYNGATAYHRAIVMDNTALLTIMVEHDKKQQFKRKLPSLVKTSNTPKVHFDGYLEFATRTLVARYFQKRMRVLNLETIKILINKGGAGFKHALGVVLENLALPISSFLMREFLSLGLDLSEIKDICLVTKCVLDSNFSLLELLLNSRVSYLNKFSQNLCNVYRNNASPHRTVEVSSARNLLDLFDFSAESYIVCTFCGSEAGERGKMKCCEEVSCETYTCENCLFFKTIDQDGLSPRQVAKRKGECKMINLLNMACSEVGNKMLSEGKTIEKVKYFYNAGIFTENLFCLLKSEHFAKMGLNL